MGCWGLNSSWGSAFLKEKEKWVLQGLVCWVLLLLWFSVSGIDKDTPEFLAITHEPHLVGVNKYALFFFRYFNLTPSHSFSLNWHKPLPKIHITLIIFLMKLSIVRVTNSYWSKNLIVLAEGFILSCWDFQLVGPIMESHSFNLGIFQIRTSKRI